MNIYLDVDGTILFKNEKVINHLDQFLKSAFSKGDVYWLTTHCRENNNEVVLRHLEPFVSSEEMDLLKKINPTRWQTLKTEVIDFSQPFLWFDDSILQIEEQILKDNGVFDSWIKVDLFKTNTLEFNSIEF